MELSRSPPSREHIALDRASRSRLIFTAILLLFTVSAAAAGAGTGLQRDVVFPAYTPMAGNAERVRRLLSPLASRRMKEQLQRAHQALRGQSVDLAQETFAL